MDARQRHLDRLRAWRAARGTRAAPIAADMDGALRSVRAAARAVGGRTAGKWTAAMPPALAELVTEARVARGVLRLRVVDPAAQFSVRRWLADGGETRMRARLGARVRSVAVE